MYFWPLIIVLILLIPVLSIVLDSQVGRALAQRLERRGLGAADDLLADRIASLEGDVQRLESDVRRLDEEGRFLQKLLEARPTERAALPEGDPHE